MKAIIILAAVLSGCTAVPDCATDTECESRYPSLYWQAEAEYWKDQTIKAEGMLERVCASVPVDVLDAHDLTECQ